MRKKPMEQVDSEWSSTRICPCGSSFNWSGVDDDLDSWMAEHKPHTNGKLMQEASDDWHKVYGKKPSPTIIALEDLFIVLPKRENE
jgi:hypothetical protein